MTMKDKVEHNEEFKKAEEDYDVVKLLSIIKKISEGKVQVLDYGKGHEEVVWYATAPE